MKKSKSIIFNWMYKNLLKLFSSKKNVNKLLEFSNVEKVTKKVK